jgi:hypothetical protein
MQVLTEWIGGDIFLCSRITPRQAKSAGGAGFLFEMGIKIPASVSWWCTRLFIKKLWSTKFLKHLKYRLELIQESTSGKCWCRSLVDFYFLIYLHKSDVIMHALEPIISFSYYMLSQGYLMPFSLRIRK